MDHQDTPAPPAPLSPAVAGSPPPGVAAPGYDRSALVPFVVHLGVGGFHRAHQAVYLDDLARRGETGWGVVGVGLHSSRMRDALAPQDNLYSVVVRGAEHDEVRVVGVLVDYLYAPDDPEAVLERLADPRTRLVTLTITGTAYPADDGVDPSVPEVAADVERPHAPGTAFGYLVEALDRRRRRGTGPFTVLSCDNVQHNGARTREAVLATAHLRDAQLADWIAAEVAFPSSMVDRITPETSPEDREELARRYGLRDRWPVVTEPFSQWVVEDSFCAGRPALERVGVQFAEDVLPYEVMKTRLLNGAHCALGYLGSLADFRTTDEAMADPRVRAHVEGFLAEASALLLDVPGIDLQGYCATLLERFSNPRVGDQLTRLCRRGSTKVPEYLLPSLRQAVDQNRPRRHLVLALATWLRYLRGVDYAGEPIDVQDAHADRLTAAALAGGTDPGRLLHQRDVFASFGDSVCLHRELHDALEALEAGPLEAVSAVCGSTPGAPAVRGAAA
ncbi:mannitol dehydrogenase family protein [Kineococcus sp. SYSU DK005]|uniref:mannitol dehydrogenase family protein n=1 Tax=Kineococcus sp. SYSU DK005 TaxID=3383126 RepID=UPI003D7DBCCF